MNFETRHMHIDDTTTKYRVWSDRSARYHDREFETVGDAIRYCHTQHGDTLQTHRMRVVNPDGTDHTVVLPYHDDDWPFGSEVDAMAEHERRFGS